MLLDHLQFKLRTDTLEMDDGNKIQINEHEMSLLSFFLSLCPSLPIFFSLFIPMGRREGREREMRKSREREKKEEKVSDGEKNQNPSSHVVRES